MSRCFRPLRPCEAIVGPCWRVLRRQSGKSTTRPGEGRFGAFVAQFCGKARRPDFPAGEARKGLPLGQAERVAVRPAR